MDKVTTVKMPLVELISLTVFTGVSSGIMGINVSYELAHLVNTKLEPFLSRLKLWNVLYMHWELEHIVGDHKIVATPNETSTARLWKSFYAFWPRKIFDRKKEICPDTKKHSNNYSMKVLSIVALFLKSIEKGEVGN